jgi:cytochrome c oxidase assembly protein Cox11
MKKLTLAIIFVLLSFPTLAGEWIAVDGGVIEIKIDAVELENKLWHFLNLQKEHSFKPREDYKYQYKVTSPQELYINAFCESNVSTNLHTTFFMVFDGGSCFFQVVLNRETGKFIKLEVNGEA